jgi:hypothetical protein
MASYGMLRRVALVRTDVSEELSSSTIRLTRIGELGKTLAVTSNRRTQYLSHKNQVHTTPSYLRFMLILTTQLWLCLSNGLFPPGIHTRTLYALISSTIRATCVIYPILMMHTYEIIMALHVLPFVSVN